MALSCNIFPSQPPSHPHTYPCTMIDDARARWVWPQDPCLCIPNVATRQPSKSRPIASRSWSQHSIPKHHHLIPTLPLDEDLSPLHRLSTGRPTCLASRLCGRSRSPSVRRSSSLFNARHSSCAKLSPDLSMAATEAAEDREDTPTEPDDASNTESTTPTEVDDGVREATELDNYDRSSVTAPANGPSQAPPPGQSWLKQFWRRQVSLTVPHVKCRDHLGEQRIRITAKFPRRSLNQQQMNAHTWHGCGHPLLCR